jgi:hypothetical protein
LVSQAILYNTRLKADLLAGGVLDKEYSTKEISMLPTLSVMKVPLEVPHD